MRRRRPTNAAPRGRYHDRSSPQPMPRTVVHGRRAPTAPSMVNVPPNMTTSRPTIPAVPTSAAMPVKKRSCRTSPLTTTRGAAVLTEPSTTPPGSIVTVPELRARTSPATVPEIERFPTVITRSPSIRPSTRPGRRSYVDVLGNRFVLRDDEEVRGNH